MEGPALSGGMTMADALIGATAVENHLPLPTGKQRHYEPIAELEVKPFRP